MADLPVTGWVLYYGDGTAVDSDSCTWDGAPVEGVQILEMLHEAPYRTLSYGHDVYNLPGHDPVKYGAWMDTTEFEALVEKVLNRCL